MFAPRPHPTRLSRALARARWRARLVVAGRVAAAFCLVGTVLVGVSLTQSVSAGPGDPPVTGSFFVDLDRDGRIDGGEGLADTDPLFPPAGVSVTAYDAEGNTAVGAVTPGAPPTFSIDVSALTGTNYRLEF